MPCAQNTYLQLLLKCADISNAAKRDALYSSWTRRIMDEFYRQGDREREKGMPCSRFMDRQNKDEKKCQEMFIGLIVSPVFDCLTTLAPELSSYVTENLKANLAKSLAPEPKLPAAAAAS